MGFRRLAWRRHWTALNCIEARFCGWALFASLLLINCFIILSMIQNEEATEFGRKVLDNLRNRDIKFSEGLIQDIGRKSFQNKSHALRGLISSPHEADIGLRSQRDSVPEVNASSHRENHTILEKKSDNNVPPSPKFEHNHTSTKNRDFLRNSTKADEGAVPTNISRLGNHHPLRSNDTKTLIYHGVYYREISKKADGAAMYVYNSGQLDFWEELNQFHGFYNLNELMNERPVVKVILLTYQRAGSSFVGELLTSGGDAFYVFEPLFPWRTELATTTSTTAWSSVAKLLGDLLDCREKIIHAWRKKGFYFYRRKPEGDRFFCDKASIRLVKTIRTRGDLITGWIARRPDIKVVHLVRDPRGIYSSVQRGGSLWKENNRNISLQCKNVENDLKLQELLGESRYYLLRYEDLVDQPLKETLKLFKFMNVEFNFKVWEYLKNHTGLAGVVEVQKNYMNTYRDRNFRHDSWKGRLTNGEIEFIEYSCLNAMRRLRYLPLQARIKSTAFDSNATSHVTHRLRRYKWQKVYKVRRLRPKQ